MAKVLCVLYDDPVGGYPPSYARGALPHLTHYPNGQTLPSPQQIDFTPGALLGSVSGALGLRTFLEEQGTRSWSQQNYLPSYQWVINNGWNIADCVARSSDL